MLCKDTAPHTVTQLQTLFQRVKINNKLYHIKTRDHVFKDNEYCVVSIKVNDSENSALWVINCGHVIFLDNALMVFLHDQRNLNDSINYARCFIYQKDVFCLLDELSKT